MICLWSEERLGHGIGQSKLWDEEMDGWSSVRTGAKNHCKGTREEGCVYNITKILEALDLYCIVEDT